MDANADQRTTLRTQDDVTVRLAGNVEFAEEVPSLLSHGGEAVGLYRTEFLFMGRGDLATVARDCMGRTTVSA